MRNKKSLVAVVVFLSIATLAFWKRDIIRRFQHPYWIEGYADKSSYFPGEKITFYLSGTYPSYRKLALTNVMGEVLREENIFVPMQLSPSKAPYQEGFGFKPTLEIATEGLPSGIYSLAGVVSFTVKAKSPEKKIVIVYPWNTVQAYNWPGGRSFYTTPATPHLSFLRGPTPINHYSESCLKWFSQNEFFQENISLITDVDMQNYDSLKGANLVLVTGQSEYWTRQARKNLDRFIEEGNPVAFLSGNTMYWQVRYNSNNTVMTGYKDNRKEEITNSPMEKTVRWEEAELQYPVLPNIGLNFQNGGMGFEMKWPGYRILRPESPLLKNTNLKLGDFLPLVTHEWDGPALDTELSTENNPVLDLKKLAAYRAELIAFTRVKNSQNRGGGFIVFQKKPTSGIVVNVGSTNWCSETGVLGPQEKIYKQLTLNIVNTLLKRQNAFSNHLETVHFKFKKNF